MEESNNQPVSKLNPIILIGIIVVVIIALGLGAAFILLNKNSSSKNAAQILTGSQNNISPTGTSASKQSSRFALEDVAMHSTENDCWLVIEGGVYDVTKFIPRHPGGNEILQGCGKDATAMFNKRPNDGTSHSPRAKEMLKRYKIGDLRS